ncbi:MAG TPA: hypothetical protein VFP72_20200, partial [Kineosporiaceae bacterium]|nr:hypothetical protein [Kineosporiaceae bacterium]
SPDNRVPAPCTVPVCARYGEDLLGEVTFTGLGGYDHDIALIRSQAWRQGWKVLEHRQAEETPELIFYAERIPLGQPMDATAGAHGGRGCLILMLLLLATALGMGLFAGGWDFVWLLVGCCGGPLLSWLRTGISRRKAGPHDGPSTPG